MKKVMFLALLMPLPAFGQLIENFETGTVSSWVQSTAGRWKADTSLPLSGIYSLHHVYDNPEAGTDCIGLAEAGLHPARGTTSWSFNVRYGYDPSSQNNWAIYLMSDIAPGILSSGGSASGYAIGVNLTGSDDSLRLWKITENRITVVANSGINWQTDIGISGVAHIIVERSMNGIWNIRVSKSPDSGILSNTSAVDAELFSSAWFDIVYRYSATKDRLLWIDDVTINGCFFKDTVPPAITEYKVTSKNSLEITLDEDAASEIMLPGNFSLYPSGEKAVSVTQEAGLKLIIAFKNDFINREANRLIISELCDSAGNCAMDSGVDFIPSWCNAGDVVISEIMADPSPAVSLPDAEFIEITNRTDFLISLKNWTLSSENQSYDFPDAELHSKEIVIVCAASDTELFAKYGRTLGLKQFPSLTDDGRILFLSDNEGNFIHGIEYSSAWHNNELKSGGGWSLELIDSDYPLYSEGNYASSVSATGGTPGKANSVSGSNIDNSFQGITNVFAEDSSTVNIRFSEPMILLPGMTEDISIAGEKVLEVIKDDPLYRQFILKLKSPLKRQESYHLNISESTADFAGNRITDNDFVFGMFSEASPGDLLFNELLFNPLPGDPDYIEVHNNSAKTLDASRLQIVSINESGESSDLVALSSFPYCIMPGTYLAVTTGRDRIISRYFSADPHYLRQISSLPSMSDDEGHLTLFNRELDLIDEVQYNDDMHYSLLKDAEGVSLEKINPLKLSNDASSWHSASEDCGFGTPGAVNSANIDLQGSGDQISISSTRISPDNDGVQDLLVIDFNSGSTGNVISVSVYDENGNYVRKIASNLLAGSRAELVWDGTADDGSLVNTGIYIILIKVYNDAGKSRQWKRVCTVLR